MRCGALVLLAILAVAPPALAESARAPDAATMTAQASLDFRIVIPETIRMDPRQEHTGRVRKLTSRSTEVQADRIVVTIARP